MLREGRPGGTLPNKRTSSKTGETTVPAKREGNTWPQGPGKYQSGALGVSVLAGAASSTAPDHRLLGPGDRAGRLRQVASSWSNSRSIECRTQGGRRFWLHRIPHALRDFWSEELVCSRLEVYSLSSVPATCFEVLDSVQEGNSIVNRALFCTSFASEWIRTSNPLSVEFGVCPALTESGQADRIRVLDSCLDDVRTG